jgi:hypothetical protein
MKGMVIVVLVMGFVIEIPALTLTKLSTRVCGAAGVLMLSQTPFTTKNIVLTVEERPLRFMLEFKYSWL